MTFSNHNHQSQSHLNKIIVQFANKNKTWIGTNLGLMIVHFPLELIVLSYLSGKIFTNMADMKTNYNKVVRFTVYFFLAYFSIEMCIIIRETYDSYFVPYLEKELRNYIIQMIIDKNEIQFDNLEMGEIVVRFLKTPAYSLSSYNVMTKFIIPFVASIFFIGIYIFYLNAKVGLLYFTLFAIYSLVMIHLCKKMLKKTKEKMLVEMSMFNKIEDTLANIHTIYTSNTIEKEKSYMDKNQEEYIKIHQQELQLNSKIKLILSTFCLVSIILLFVYCTHLYRHNKISQEILIALVTLFLFMCRFLGYTSRRIVEGMMTIGSFMDSNKFMDDLYNDTFTDGELVDFIDSGEIIFDSIDFRYTKKSPLIFSNFTLAIPSKSHIVLIGDIGSGKTTFLRLVLGFFTLENGNITIDGTSIASSKRSYLRHKIAYINQTTKLFDRSILENILYGCPDKYTEKDVITFLERHNLSSLFNRTEGLQAKAGRGGDNISGGMRQIILLLRCIFKESPIVILDEATSNIDARHRQSAIIIIKQLFKEKTVICVSHDQDIIELFDRRLIFQMDKQPQVRSYNK